MNKNLVSLLFWILFLPQYFAVCPMEEIDGAVWKSAFSTEDEKTSNPMCLDKNRLPVTRKCVNNTWVQNMINIKCDFIQYDNWRDTFCPSGYNRLSIRSDLCILISKPQKWSELCLQSTEADPLYFLDNQEVSSMLFDHGSERYWLPVKRENRLAHTKYKVVTRYNSKFDESLISEPIDGDCLTHSPVEGKFHLSNCDNIYSMVCLIDVHKFFGFSNYHCPQDAYTTFNPRYHNQCYRIVQLNDSNPQLQPLLIESAESQFLADKLVETSYGLSKSHVQIDIMPVGSPRSQYNTDYKFNRPIWIKSRQSILFTNWGSSVRNSRLDGVEPYTALKNGLWHFVFDLRNISHVMHAQNISLNNDPAFKPFKFIKTNHTIQMDKVEDAAPFFAQHCFVNDDEATDTNMLHDIGRKFFRCEGFSMISLKLIKSTTIEIWNKETSKYEIFVLVLKNGCVKCDFIHQFQLLQNQIKSFQDSTFRDINNRIIQFRKIIDIDTDSRIVTYSVHLLVRKRSLTIKNMYRKILVELPQNTIHLRHIDTCLGTSGNYFNFPDVSIGEESTNKNCRQPNGDYSILKCIGNSDIGAFWENEINLDSLECDYGQFLNEVYQNISESDPMENIDILVSVTKTHNTIESLQIINKILNKLLNNSGKTHLFDLESHKPLENRPFALLLKTYDNALRTSDCIVQDSLESENVSSNFLKNFKKLIETYLTTNAASIGLNITNDGSYLIREENIILLVIDPFSGPVTGMWIHKNRLRRRENNFSGFSVQKYYSNISTQFYINRRLEAGINLDFHTINKLKEQYQKFRIVLSVFYKDSWFKENSQATKVVESRSKIIGVFIPEHPDEELPDGIFTILKTSRNRQSTDVDGCSNWRVGAPKREWNKNLYEYDQLDRKLVNCPIKYTSFSSYVQLIGNDKLVDCDIKSYTIFMKWLTISLCILSVISVILIFVAAVKIPIFLANETTPLVLNVAFANGLQMFVYTLFVEFKLCNADGNTMIEEFCLVTGAILHYLTLVGFFLSLITTDHLIRAYVIGTTQQISTMFKIKVILFGWVPPIVIVSLSICFDLVYDTELYLPIDVFDDNSSICYPVEKLLLISIHIPIGIIVILHLIIFACILFKTNQSPESVITNVSHLKEKCLTYLYVLSILSINWIFAVIVYYVENCYVHLIFSFLFTLTVPSQGLQIFLVSVVFNRVVRYYCKRWYINRQFD